MNTLLDLETRRNNFVSSNSCKTFNKITNNNLLCAIDTIIRSIKKIFFLKMTFYTTQEAVNNFTGQLVNILTSRLLEK